MKHFTLKLLPLSAAIALFSALPAFAQDAPPPDFSTERLGTERSGGDRGSRSRGAGTLIPAGLLYASFDTDGDYAVSRAEVDAGVLRSFEIADKNSNGTVSLVELAAWRKAVLGSLDLMPGNTQFDKNFDNQIEASEFQTVLLDLFTGFDRNENGELEFSEMTQELRRNAPQGRGEQGREGGRSSTGSGKGRGQGKRR